MAVIMCRQIVVPEYSLGVMASDFEIGSTVKLLENGVPVDYLVVHQGLPGAMYDNSCDGVWLLRKTSHSTRVWNTSAVNNYKASSIHSFLNGTFLGLFDAATQAAIVQAKIPYVNGTGNGGTVSTGADGLSTKIFLLSGTEIGWNYDNEAYYLSVEGSVLYFYSGTAGTSDLYANASVWLRSPTNNNSTSVYYVGTSNQKRYGGASYMENGVRPALILPSTARFDPETNVFMGVA